MVSVQGQGKIGNTYPWPVGVMKYNMTCTRLSLKRGLRLIRLSSARMSSYCRSRYPTISEKLGTMSAGNGRLGG
jgi:hypothetical protein